jgi:uncharacterized damage-inducible protein DinB
MPQYRTILEEALEAWGYTREGVIAEVENIRERDFGFKPADGSRTVGELTWHIVESGLLMAGELTRAGGDFRREPYEQLLAEHARGVRRTTRKAALLQLLKRTHADGASRIAAAGELHMLQFITRFDGKPGTRLAWMHHGISHEEYHRGQLALYARIMGRVPALTRLILGS